MALLVKAFHLAALGFYAYVSYCLYYSGSQNQKSNDENIKAVGKYTFRFLTNWTYGTQFLYFTCCVIVHFLEIISPLRNLKEKLSSFSNCLFTTIAGPMAFVVTITFWILYIMDRELVYPRWLDQVIPYWINHAIHSLNSLAAIIDMCLVNHAFPSFVFGVKAIGLYLGSYAVCLYGTYFVEGVWLYPFLRELTWAQRGIFAVVNVSGALLIFALTKMFSGLLWGGKTVPTKSAKSKKSGGKSKTKKAV